MAHTAVFRLASEISPWWLDLSVLAQVLVLASFVMVAITHRGLHDVIAGTRVVDRGSPGVVR